MVEYKLTGKIVGDLRHGHGTRKAKLQAGRYVLKEGGCENDRVMHAGRAEREPELLYREVFGELARCVTRGDV